MLKDVINVDDSIDSNIYSNYDAFKTYLLFDYYLRAEEKPEFCNLIKYEIKIIRIKHMQLGFIKSKFDDSLVVSWCSIDGGIFEGKAIVT